MRFDIDKKKAIAKMTSLILSTTLTVSILFSGCSFGNDEQTQASKEPDAAKQAQTISEKKSDVTSDGISKNAAIMIVGNTNVTYSEVMVYIMMLKDRYETTFSKDIWKFNVASDKSFEDMAKDEIINQIARLKIMGFEADSLGVELNSDEKLQIEDEAVKFLQGITMDDQEKYGINQNVVTTIYTDNYLAQKVFDVVTADVDTTVTDDDATAIKLKQIKVAFNGVDKDGNDLSGTDEQKAFAKKRIDTIYNAVVNKKKNFDYYAEKYSDSSEKTISVIKGDKSVEQVFKDAASVLKKKQYSSVIEGENAYYLLYCVDNNDTSDIDGNKDVIINSRQDESFNEIYSKWFTKYDTAIVTSLWNRISFGDIE